MTVAKGMTVVDWLLDSDPSIRWQVVRDLTKAPVDVVAAERARVAREGWGARLLDLQGEDGQWAGGACFPSQSIYRLVKGERPPRISPPPPLPLPLGFSVEPSSVPG